MLGAQFRLCHALCLSHDRTSVGPALYPSIDTGGIAGSAPTYSPGILKYMEEAKKLIAEREAALARMRTMKFDTIAVHGLYTVEEAIERQPGRDHRAALPLDLPGLPRLGRAGGRPGLPRPDLVLHRASPTRRPTTYEWVAGPARGLRARRRRPPAASPPRAWRRS
ncbi:MAG: hypothetical protein MZV63_64410 [Marinilabiliales bacterium]|nr:hypothetical protein [Marinilabiliales bacterium]